MLAVPAQQHLVRLISVPTKQWKYKPHKYTVITNLYWSILHFKLSKCPNIVDEFQ